MSAPDPSRSGATREPTGSPESPLPPPSAYPDKLKRAELELLQQRRNALSDRTESPLSEMPPDAVGLAFSGGGIRSATFSLGVLQALAHLELLGKVDFLSTVSGGGYLGSFYGAWLNRGRHPLEELPIKERVRFWKGDYRKGKPDKSSFAAVQEKLNDPDAFPVFWLRQNGRYLTPGGAGDALLAAAVALRNWFSLHYVLGVFLLLLLTGATQLGGFLPKWPWSGGSLCPPAAASPMAATSTPYPAPEAGATPAPPPAPDVIVHWSPWRVVLLGPLGLAVILGIAYWFPRLDTRWRNRLSRWLAGMLGAAAAVAALVVIDTAGATLWGNRAVLRELLCRWIWETGGTAAVLLLLVRKGVGLIRDLATQEEKISVPMNVLVWVAALVLGTAWLVSLDVGAHYLAGRWPWMALAVVAVLALVASQDLRFINLSSLANLYGARLTRAYLGASNPDRPANQKISETLSGDNVPFETYAPTEVGGPLHFINVTVNETIDGRTGTEQYDRKGFILAIGPAGVSARVQHHALWIDWKGRPRGGLDPIRHDGFHCLTDATQQEHAVQQLSVGQWVGISGAAFSTGVGARTNPALGFLCGFFNVRLGFWWDSGVIAYKRETSQWGRFLRALAQFPTTFFPVQAQLLNEFRARFHGSARQHWYLSDGGHYENTAAYELIRRRVPFIIICDDGCDPGRQMEDFANLVRKARIDFNAEITVLEPDKKKGDSSVHRYLGTFTEVTTLAKETRRSPKGALLAHVRYSGPGPADSYILLLKPTVNGTEPVDVQNYQAANRDFPQQTTMDQFFDEEQWESYRKLGEEIGGAVFAGTGPKTDLRRHFASLAESPR